MFKCIDYDTMIRINLNAHVGSLTKALIMNQDGLFVYYLIDVATSFLVY